MDIKKFQFLRTMNLYIRIIDSSSYIDKCQILEKSENQDILYFINIWLDELKDEINSKILGYYYYPQNITKKEVRFIRDELNSKYDSFKSIVENMKFVPIEPPLSTLKTMIDEIISSPIPDEMKIYNIYLKNISEFNFSKSKMSKPGFSSDVEKEIENKVGSVPNVLSMAIIYHMNPLMWPLIFHEYGHSIFEKINKKNQYQIIFDEIRAFSVNQKSGLPILVISNNLSEIFSDLFAINYYGSNFLFAFYFHEILCSETNKLLNLSDDNELEFNSHPPSAIRIKYMITELEKRGYTADDEVLEKLLKYHEPFAKEISEKIDSNPSLENYVTILDFMYEKISKFAEDLNLFENNKIKLELHFIDDLLQDLQNKLPIGTSYPRDISLGEALNKDNECFDLERSNRIREMVYAGWKFLFKDMIDDFYEISNENEYLKHSDIDYKKITSIEKKLEKFSYEYDLLLKNINYSIETSVIVSNLLGDDFDIK